MPDVVQQSLTSLLHEVNHDRPGAFDELVDAVYADLRAMAAGKMQQQFVRSADALTNPPTGLVSDLVMRLREQHQQWQNREQFFAIAARLLRELVLDYRRHRDAAKRGGGKRGEMLDSDCQAVAVDSGFARVDIADLFDRLLAEHPRAAEVVLLHSRGLSLDDIVARIGVSLSTVERDLRLARAWLRARLEER